MTSSASERDVPAYTVNQRAVEIRVVNPNLLITTYNYWK
jgi:hypothetical protein